ncbi:DUF3108 domain-containing protein [Afipia sp. 1NLS2]|uniref:DUF3108 domain-containing protein n=1 Tax=Afipia sp. 1NLS2 TaxID=666684 RepID=UPI0001DA0134|nr:DUF3108 domain-containing protein [Afipia sp. 1NLS2]EFI53156.1 conserved hypothetical protein [Afipia sp. 1NLS2]
MDFFDRGLWSRLLYVAPMLLLSGPAHAQGRLDAKYQATLSGIVIGKGNWTIVIGDKDYSGLTSGGTTGLVKAIGGGHGTGSAQGKVLAGRLVPEAYLSSVFYGKKNETIRIAFAGERVTASTIEPEPPPTPDRIPVMDAQRRSVSDPMSGVMFVAPGKDELPSPQGCATGAAIFDGRMRYDLQLAFKALETVTLANGARLSTVVCSVSFKPLAGYVPSRAAIKYLVKRQDMDVALAPIAGTRVMVPVRVRIPTPIGLGMVQATEFNTAAQSQASKRAN